MTGERYLTYLVKVQGSKDPIRIHSAGSSLVNLRNGLRHGFKKAFLFQLLEKSVTAFEVEPTKMLACRNKKGKTLYTELLNAKISADIEAIQIPAANRLNINTNIYFTSYAPVPPFMIKKIVE